MKLPELKAVIAPYDKKDLMYLIAELYKLIPKAKKEESNIDEVILKVSSFSDKPKPTSSKASKGSRPLYLITAEVKEFIEHAKAWYYAEPNRVVSKTERPKWRFKVKNWYKELTGGQWEAAALPEAAQALQDLYELLCKACGPRVFSSDQPFQSAGIGQGEFFHSVLSHNIRCQPPKEFTKNAIRLIVENHVHYDMLDSDLMMIYIEFLDSPEWRELAIDSAERHRKVIQFAPREKTYGYSSSFADDYETREKNNKLTKFIFHCHAASEAYETGVAYYQAHHQEGGYDKTGEIKLYVLVSMLLPYKQPDLTIQVIEEAESKGIQPRVGILKVKAHILEKGEVPPYIS